MSKKLQNQIDTFNMFQTLLNFKWYNVSLLLLLFLNHYLFNWLNKCASTKVTTTTLNVITKIIYTLEKRYFILGIQLFYHTITNQSAVIENQNYVMTAAVYFLMLNKFVGFSALVLLIDFLPADLVSRPLLCHANDADSK